MSNVYIDAGALLGNAGSGAASSRIILRAARTCGHLRELGHNVILVGRRATVPEAPDEPGAWLVSADPDTCERARRERRLRTVFVGPATPGRGNMARPADVVARDLADAVVTIMAAEAMPAA